MRKQNLLMISGIILSLMFCLAFDCKSRNLPSTENTAPSEEIIKRLLAEKFTSNAYATRKETLEFESIDYYQPNQEVYPVRAKFTRVIKDSDGTGKKFAMDGLFHFLRNRDNEWTFSVQEWYKNEQVYE